NPQTRARRTDVVNFITLTPERLSPRFGGLPRACLYDNTKVVVLGRDSRYDHMAATAFFTLVYQRTTSAAASSRRRWINPNRRSGSTPASPRSPHHERRLGVTPAGPTRPPLTSLAAL